MTRRHIQKNNNQLHWS